MSLSELTLVEEILIFSSLCIFQKILCMKEFLWRWEKLVKVTNGEILKITSGLYIELRYNNQYWLNPAAMATFYIFLAVAPFIIIPFTAGSTRITKIGSFVKITRFSNHDIYWTASNLLRMACSKCYFVIMKQPLKEMITTLVAARGGSCRQRRDNLTLSWIRFDYLTIGTRSLIWQKTSENSDENNFFLKVSFCF